MVFGNYYATEIRIMEKAAKGMSKKNPFLKLFDKVKDKNVNNRNKNTESKKNIIQHLIHPDYILFDWEFFSRELEFE